MALRGTTGAAGTASSASASITYAGAGNIQVGDLILLISTLANGNNTTTFTDPSGFTTGSSISLSDVNIGAQGAAWLHIAVKIAAAGDTGTPTYASSASAAGYWNQQLRVYSGRINSSIAAAFPNNLATASGSSGGTPYSYTVNYPAPLAGDDQVLIVGANVANSTTPNGWGASATGFSNGLETAYGSYQYDPPLWSADNVGASSGSSGSVVTTITNTSAGSSLYPTGFFLSLPSAGGGSTPAYYLGSQLWF